MTRRIVIMVTYPATADGDIAIEELDASHLWPFVPRVGDNIEWLEDGQHWEQVVDTVNVHLDPGENNADVWVGTAGEAHLFDFDDVAP